MSIKDWSTTADSNNSASPNGFPEGMAPSGVNNAAREVMASVREHYDAPEWRDWGHTIVYGSATTFTTSVGNGDTTAIYHAARRVRAVGSLTGTIYGTISSSAFTTQTTVTVVWDSGSLSNEALTISLGTATDQISIGSGASAAVIPSTTVMVFYQAAAPIGWTQVVTQNDKALRVRSTVGGGSGGTHALSSPPSSSHVHTGPSHQHSGPNHQHSGPSHNHQWYNFVSGSTDQSYNSGGSGANLTSSTVVQLGIIANTSTVTKINADFYTSNASGVTGFGGTGNTGLGGTANTGTGNLTAFAPQYIDVIICSKD